jgi:hypothetical protein
VTLATGATIANESATAVARQRRAVLVQDRLIRRGAEIDDREPTMAEQSRPGGVNDFDAEHALCHRRDHATKALRLRQP